MRLGWFIKMARRDARRNTGRLLLFMSSIVLGIAALVAINSFGENLKRQIESEARDLLGADLEISNRTPIPDEVVKRLDSLQLIYIEEINFASMAFFPKTEETRLVHVRAVEPGFPFYGELATNPTTANKSFKNKDLALIDQTLALQFNAKWGDKVRIGSVDFEISGEVISVPGQSEITTTVAPPVFIPLETLPETGLLQLGSRMLYHIYVKYPENFDSKIADDQLKPWLEKFDVNVTDVADRQQSLGEAYADLIGFLNLTAFIALVLGCMGVAGSVNVYIKGKINSIAILRCLGVKAHQAILIYLFQVLAMGVLGSIIGAILGLFVQFVLPQIFAQFLPVSVTPSISFISIFNGVVLGTIASVVFALPPLMQIRHTGALQAIRSTIESPKTKTYGAYALIVVFIFVFSWLQLNRFLWAVIFTAGLLISFGLLSGFSRFIMWAVRRFFPVQHIFVLRQGLSNLYRPQNQTRLLIVTIGLGTALIATLLMSREILANKLKFSSESENRPNMVLFDIQSDQVADVEKLVAENQFPILGEVPIVTMRLESVKGKSVTELRGDSLSQISAGMLNREYRVTYRDSLTDSEQIVKGKWVGKHDETDDAVSISMDENFANRMGVDIGDELEFNIQGAIVKVKIGSLRKIDFQRVTTNFLVVFPTGVLENAPKFHVILTRFNLPEESARLQAKVVRDFPNVSIVDLELILKTVDDVLGKVSFVIQFMAFFSIFTGFIVLLGSIMLSKYQRLRESVLLRTLGAQKSHILRINFLEYLILGSLAAASGIGIALIAGSLIAWFSFNTILMPDLLQLVIMFLAIVGASIAIGLINVREVVQASPLEVLRRESGT